METYTLGRRGWADNFRVYRRSYDKTQHIDFFLDIQLYIVIEIAIPPWKRTALSPVPFCQRLWDWQRIKRCRDWS